MRDSFLAHELLKVLKEKFLKSCGTSKFSYKFDEWVEISNIYELNKDIVCAAKIKFDLEKAWPQMLTLFIIFFF